MACSLLQGGGAAGVGDGAARRRIERGGGRMALACASGIVRSALQTMGILDVFPPFASRAEGVAALQARFSDP